MTTQKLILTLGLCLCLCRASAIKVKLSDVKAITLTAGQFTTGRRSAPVLQQQCRGHLCNYAPTTIQCTNTGSDGLDAQWDCKADLPEWLSFKNPDVNCEGYDYPTDPYILAGSCGMSYSLQGTPPYESGSFTAGEQTTGIGGLMVLVIILLCCCNNRGGRPYPYYGGGGSNAATAAAVGAAAGYAAGRSSGWGWGRSWGGGGYRRHSYGRRSSGGFGSSSRSSRRTAHAFCGTSRR